MWPFSGGYQVLVQKKCEQRETLVAAALQFKPSDHAEYLKATASEIVRRIERGEWTASKVIEAYIARAAMAHQATNCITEVLFDEARKLAKELDVEFAATNKLRGPLHGVPISLKDQFDLVGVDSSIGFSARLGKPATINADVVALLKAAGGIVVAKTNVPQTLFSFECCNPVFGRTTNPYNSHYTCGGSSGGEAALLSMDGSALGVGTDIGGSLRIPTAYCGIYSLKPSPYRVSFVGSGSPVPGFEGIITLAGPMGRSVDDLELFSRLVFGMEGRSQDVAPILYREPTLASKLRFGYYIDYYFKSSPANKRAVLETVAALRKQGHECIEIEVPDPMEPFDVFVGLTSADGYKTLLSGIGSDPLDPSLVLVKYGPKVPRFITVFVAWIVQTLLKDIKFPRSLRANRVKPAGEYWQWTARRNAYATKFREEVWDKHSLDAIIAPVQALPQAPTGSFARLFALSSSTTLYNVLNNPVGCVPVTTVDPVKDQITEEWTKAPSTSLVESALYRGKQPVYDPIATKGMPVGVQVIGKRWKDEEVLAIMRVVDDSLGKNRGFGPGNWDSRNSH
ncbi:amidase [Mycena rebaudengoi]|nr:amidase [Mycena rebaudengoi]